ncbi:hypothetical protein D3C72_1224540 [compost metagenome]
MHRTGAVELEPGAAADAGQQQDQGNAQADHDAQTADQPHRGHRQHRAEDGQGAAGAPLARHLCGERGAHHVAERMRVLGRQRHQHVALAAQPEHEGGHEHQDAGDAERPLRAQVLQRQRNQQRGEQRAEVDDPVEGVEDDLGQVLVALVELVAHERGHQRLDPPGTQGDQAQAEEEALATVLEHRQAGVAGAVDQAEPQNGVVLAEELVGQPAAEQREEIHADHEAVHDVLGFTGSAFRSDFLQQQRGDQELHQDVAHPVETEPLAGLIADDVRDLARHLSLAGDGGDCVVAHPVRHSCKTKGARVPEPVRAKHAAGLHDSRAKAWQAHAALPEVTEPAR